MPWNASGGPVRETTCSSTPSAILSPTPRMVPTVRDTSPTDLLILRVAAQYRPVSTNRAPDVSLTDAQWARIEPLLPDRTPKRGGRWRDHREVIEAIAFKFRTGTQWVHLPERPSPHDHPEHPRTRHHVLDEGHGDTSPVAARPSRCQKAERMSPPSTRMVAPLTYWA
ncbi:transposase [Streptomyces sp. NPDC058008]|uniref:transposase n=1 Tax=Streptomyces sp. NPDC058008 TaxID=3346303 RepID=UPI0036EB9C77